MPVWDYLLMILPWLWITQNIDTLIAYVKHIENGTWMAYL